MPEIKLVKKYPHISDEDVSEIFQNGYMQGFENGRKNCVPIDWLEKNAITQLDFGLGIRMLIKKYREEQNGEK